MQLTKEGPNIILIISIFVFAVAEAQLLSTSVSSSSSSTTSFIKIRGNKSRKPELCKESLPRKSEDLPALVITGKVKEVYMAPTEVQNNNTTTSIITMITTTPSDFRTTNKALVNIGRVIKGNQQLLNSDIIISGFNSSSLGITCPNYVKPNDTYIFLLNQDGDKKYSIQGSNILSMNLNNLDRINAIALDEPSKRRGLIEDILCEAHYCPYGRCVVINEKAGQVHCQCPDSCPSLPMPVCGSDNTTYTNECNLIKEGCKRQRPLFVTKEASC